MGIFCALYFSWSIYEDGVERSKRLRETLIEERKRTLREYMDIALKETELLYQQTLSSEISIEETRRLKKKLMESIRDIRYGDSGYFWINDFTPVVLMHPMKKNLDGKYVGNRHDANGKPHFQEMVEIARTKGEGFLTYMFEKPGYRNEDGIHKLSYIKAFPEWGWIVGTGVYLEDIDRKLAEELEQNKKKAGKIILGSILIGGVVVLIFFSIAHYIINGLFPDQIRRELEQNQGSHR